MKNTITRTDIAEHVVAESCAGADFTDAQLDAITAAVIDAAPLSTWRLQGLDYQSTVLDDEGFWAIVEQITA